MSCSTVGGCVCETKYASPQTGHLVHLTCCRRANENLQRKDGGEEDLHALQHLQLIWAIACVFNTAGYMCLNHSIDCTVEAGARAANSAFPACLRRPQYKNRVSPNIAQMDSITECACAALLWCPEGNSSSPKRQTRQVTFLFSQQ